MLLSQVFYVSRATGPHDTVAINSILAVSRRNNYRDDVTGCLLVSAGLFGQVLEGNPKVIDDKLQKIACDNRHFGLRVLLQRPMSTREHDGWAMGYVYDLDVADALMSIFVSVAADSREILSVMDRMKPDSVMGALR